MNVDKSIKKFYNIDSMTKQELSEKIDAINKYFRIKIFQI